MATTKSKIRSHRDLMVWRRAMELAREIYRLTETFPRREVYGLTAQMRRSAVSVAANIAEGHARRATRDYIRFLSISNGSLRELETYLDVSLALGYVSAEQLSDAAGLAAETGKMLTRLRGVLKRMVACPPESSILNPES